MPLGDHSGVTIEPILQVNREADFCQEFFDDVTVPADHLLGAENDGWAVAQRLLFHERNTTAGIGIGHGYMGPRSGGVGSDTTVRRTTPTCSSAPPRAGAPTVIPPSGSSSAAPCVDMLANEFARARIMAGQLSGELDGPWGSLLKLGEGMDTPALTAIVAGDRRVERRDLERRRTRW